MSPSLTLSDNRYQMHKRWLYTFSAFQALGAVIFVWIILTLVPRWNAQRRVGTILLVVGLGLVGLARFHLGESFAVWAKAQKLVTHGLYSKIRNPVYVFGIIAFAGVILILQMPALWFALAFLIVCQTVRAHREAIVFEAAFGDAYRSYRRSTWF